MTTTRLVRRAPGASTAVIVIPALATAVRDAAVRAHLAIGLPARFPVFEERSGVFTKKGELSLADDALEISHRERSERVRLDELRVAVRAGFLELAWTGDRARIAVSDIGDAPALLHRLEGCGIVIGTAEAA